MFLYLKFIYFLQILFNLHAFWQYMDRNNEIEREKEKEGKERRISKKNEQKKNRKIDE